ncbi:toll-like receptor 6 [Bombina bombina]|uniref:toll-like receptor 6 n=1 Tax=Bombina bombina TaxID=8345 RepID=UPI00235ADAD1|nr:toll-like receptor 6 [Bombina bombina]
MKNKADQVNKHSLMHFIIIYILMPISTENEIEGLFFKKQLDKVPSNVPFNALELDLSQNIIQYLQETNFHHLLNLKFLNLSYNLIEELDGHVFKKNIALKHLDLSYNNLKIIKCSSLYFMKSVTHLNLSYNNFETMELCKEFNTLEKLSYLGLSATKIRRYDFINIAQMEFKYVFLGLEALQEYEAGSLQLLNTGKLHISIPEHLVNQFLLNDALNTSRTLEVSKIGRDKIYDFSIESLANVNKRSKVLSLIVSNITTSWTKICRILASVWNSSIESFSIHNYNRVQDNIYVQINFIIGSLKSLAIDHVTTEIFFYKLPHPAKMWAEMLVENFTYSNADVIHFFCPEKQNIFRFLSFHNNGITDEIFQKCKTLTSLEIFILRNNKLESLLKLSVMTSTMKSLSYLDLSKNHLSYNQGENCNWTESLIFLNLSENSLSDLVFSCIPINIQILDLYKNQITRVPEEVKTLKYLKEINLALNKLRHFPDCQNFWGSLNILRIEENVIDSSSINFLNRTICFKSVSAGKNPFQCNCELREFILTEKQSPGKLVGWPESYICEYPDEYRGILLQNFYISEISCNIYILLGTVLGTMLIFCLCMIFFCIYFDLPWYFYMMYKWIQTKHRVRNINLHETKDHILFHAFISYNHQDSAWVHEHLIPNLEKNESIKLCHHKRDFIPGKAIIENIVHCIEKSFKSIFVLSPNFIQSEWCHYELYFAEHKLFGKQSNNLILILLEPIPQYVIPNKYYKLKAIMKHRTYVEWPKEKSKHGLFFANLREAININLHTADESIRFLNSECKNHQMAETTEELISSQE